MISALAARFGFVRQADISNDLQFAWSVGKRLDEHREVVEAIAKKTKLFVDCPWHVVHMAKQDDYLMRLFQLMYGCWPDDDQVQEKTGECVRARPHILGKCGLPEYEEDGATEAQPAARSMN